MTSVADARRRLRENVERWIEELHEAGDVRNTLGIGIGQKAVGEAEGLIRLADELLVGADNIPPRHTLGQLVQILRTAGGQARMTCLGRPRAMVVPSDHTALAALTTARNAFVHPDFSSGGWPDPMSALQAALAVADLPVFDELECGEKK